MNDVIHRLTGRATGFPTPLLEHGNGGEPRAQSELREWLGLNNRRTDSSVRALLVAAEAHPEDCPIELWFSCCDLPLEVWSVVGGELIPTSQKPADVVYLPAVFPFPTSFQLTYYSPDRMLFTTSEGSELIGVTPVGTDLAVQWPAWTGINGALRPHQAWGVNFQVTIQAPPVSFPYAALRQAVLARADAAAMLQAHNVLDAFFSAVNPVRAAALLTRALIA